jgi:hypothetical protein
MLTYSKKKPVLIKNKGISLQLQRKDIFRSNPLSDITNLQRNQSNESVQPSSKSSTNSQKRKRTMHQLKRHETRHPRNSKEIQVYHDELPRKKPNRKDIDRALLKKDHKSRHRSSGEDIQVYNEELQITGEPEPEWIISPRKLFASSSQSSDDLVLAKAEFCAM